MKHGILKSKASKIWIRIILLILIIVVWLWYNLKPALHKPKEPSEKGMPSLAAIDLMKIFPFSEEASLKEWEEKVFKGKVVYRIEKTEPLSYVRAKSEGSASALYYKMNLDAKKKDPVISWRWRVEKFPEKRNPETLEKQNEDDFAGRVYVIFPAPFILNSKVLEYIWAETLPAGTTGTSPYSSNIKLIVLQSGPAKSGEWRYEERDVISDYVKMFGKRPERDLGAVAFMTNTEHTGTSADAMYDEIVLGYKKSTGDKGGGK